MTLELGGKSPAIVDQSASLVVAVRRIMWYVARQYGLHPRRASITPDVPGSPFVPSMFISGASCKTSARRASRPTT